MEVLRVTKRLGSKEGLHRFLGVPASTSSHARGLEVAFIAEGRTPDPSFDPVSGFIRLFYPSREQNEVLRLLESKRKRFCYFWRSRDEALKHAWLLTSA